MEKKHNSIRRILKNTSYLAFGSIISKGLMMVVFIYVGRLLGPDQYGTYFTALEFVVLVGLFSKLGFDMAAIREGAKNLSEADRIQNELLPIRVYFTIIVIIISILLVKLLGYKQEVQKIIFILLPVVFIGGAVNSGLIEHFNTSFRIIETMKIVTIVQISRAFIFFVLSFLLIISDFFNIYILVIIVIISSIFAFAIQFYYVKKYFNFEVIYKINFSFLSKIIRPVLLFGIVSILYMVSMKIDIQLLSNLSSQYDVGIYVAGWQINNIGIVFISALSLSLFPNSARRIKEKNYRKKLAIFILGLTIIISFGCFIISFYSSEIVVLLFGNNFVKSASILSIIIWFIPIRLSLLWGSQVLECGDFLFIRIIVYVIPMIINFALNYIYIPQYGGIASAYIAIISSLLMFFLVTGTAMYISKYKL